MKNCIGISTKNKADVKNSLHRKVVDTIHRFPRLFDESLEESLERLLANAPNQFILNHSTKALKTLLLVQYFLQKKIESALKKEEPFKRLVFLRLLRIDQGIGIACIYPVTRVISKEQLLHTFRSMLPGSIEIPSTSFLWHHPDHLYRFGYCEVRKLRGEEPTCKELKLIEKSLQEQLLAVPPLTPALFWPYNEEESFRQIQLLQNEMGSAEDIPHVLIQFQEQTSTFLTFLVHFARPQTLETSITAALHQLPTSLPYCLHFQRVYPLPFPIELGVFSLQIPATIFDVHGSINLLYARRHLMKYLEMILGEYRDYNGGLFERQQQHFEWIRVHLSDKIPFFDLFAEKLFYALHPVEKRLSLSLHVAEELFNTFWRALEQHQNAKITNLSQNILILKDTQRSELPSIDTSLKHCIQAEISMGDFHYFCLIDRDLSHILSCKRYRPAHRCKSLHLCFQEGAPLSLSPYHASGDMRCRVLSKLLFEGLVRLNAHGEPTLTGACDTKVSADELCYTFKLRPSRWSNGEKVTAIDYLTSYRSALTGHVSHPECLHLIKNASEYKETKEHVDALGIKAVNTQTLQITLEQPDPYFLHKLSQPCFFPLFGAMREPKWFNGPYLVREQHRDILILEQNPYYWDHKAPFFEQITIRYLKDAQSIFSLFQEGTIDWIGEPLTALSAQSIYQLLANQRLFKREANRRFLLHFNTKTFPLSCAFLRKALSLAIDRELICKEIFPFSLPSTPYQVDKEQANALFDQALDVLKLTRSTFPPLIFTHSHQTGREKLARQLESTWKKVLGITVHSENIEWNLFRKKLETGAFEIAGTIQEAKKDHSIDFLSRLEGESSWNFSQWQCPPYRQLLNSACLEKQNRKILEAQTLLEEEVPFTPLFHYTHLYAHAQNLENYCFDEEGCVDFSASFLT